MNELPLITVLIATYNYEKLISFAIESIIHQDYPIEKIEIIVVDDGSVDNTKFVVESYSNQIQIDYLYQNNNGKASATRVGLERAKGKYLFVLDADDYYLPDCLTKVVNCFETDSTIVQVSHFALRLDGENIFTPQERKGLLLDAPIDGIDMLKKNTFEGCSVGLGSTFAGKLSVLKNINIPDEIDMYIDFFLFIYLAKYGKIVQLNDNLSIFRRHNSSYSEGTKRFEDNKKRSLRYLKSAKSIYDESIKFYSDSSLQHYFYNFYLQHKWASRNYIDFSKIRIFINLTKNILYLFPHYKNKILFLKNNLRVLLKK